MAKIGTVICGKYEVTELIGTGGMSHVYRAVDVNLKKEWAVKEIRKNACTEVDRLHIQSAIVEANMMKKLDHPAIPRVVDIVEQADAMYVVMDYIKGETLENLLGREGKLSVEKVVECGKLLCEVLAYLHRQTPPIIYRDMKPGNVIITADGNVKLIDFGIAREYKERDTTDTVCLGTVGYAAPEQTTGVVQTDPRTDIYNLGVTLFQLLTGKRPERLAERGHITGWFGRRIPEGLAYIIEKCVQQNPKDRYQKCEELLADLENYECLDREGKTKEYYERKNWRIQILTGGMSVMMALTVLYGAYFMKQEYRAVSDYNGFLQEAESTTTVEEKQKYYLKAIEARPEETEPYFCLIGMIGEDAMYEVFEEQILRPLIERNLPLLQKQEAYAKLAYELGMLYFHYYDYGKTEQTDNELTRIKSACYWFEEALCYEKETEERYEEMQRYCEIGTYVESLLKKPSEAADWGNYEVYKKEVVSGESQESAYRFDRILTNMMGKYLSRGSDIKITEMNQEALDLEKSRIFLEKNGVLQELIPEQEYTVAEKEKQGEWYTYEYCVNESVFCEEGIYEIEVFSMDENGRIYQNVRGMNPIEIVFGIDKTSPIILAVGVINSGGWFEDSRQITIIVEDNMAMESVEVYVNKQVRDVIEDGEKYLFIVGKEEKIETITVIARDAAGNETRRELQEIRAELEQYRIEK